jgi:hypothetical protein
MDSCVGNEEGCKNGKRWEQDPRCHPYCPGTVMKKGYDNTAMRLMGSIMIIFIITAIVILYVRRDLFFPRLTTKSEQTS